MSLYLHLGAHVCVHIGAMLGIRDEEFIFLSGFFAVYFLIRCKRVDSLIARAHEGHFSGKIINELGLIFIRKTRNFLNFLYSFNFFNKIHI